MCGDDAGASQLGIELSAELVERGCSVLTYGTSEGLDWRAIRVAPTSDGGTQYDVEHYGHKLCSVTLPLPGLYNVRNSLAAVAAACIVSDEGESSVTEKGQTRNGELTEGVGEKYAEMAIVAAKALAEYEGVARRFQLAGVVGRCIVYDDYAHHPTEVWCP